MQDPKPAPPAVARRPAAHPYGPNLLFPELIAVICDADLRRCNIGVMKLANIAKVSVLARLYESQVER